jgi:hypothetical protein
MNQVNTSLRASDTFGYVADLGASFSLLITESMLAPNCDSNHPWACLVVTDQGQALDRRSLLYLVHNAFLRLGIQVPPFDSEPFSKLVLCDDALMFFVESRVMVHARTFRGEYGWVHPSQAG